MFESLVEWKNGTVSTDIHLQAEISGSMLRVVLRESNNNKLICNDILQEIQNQIGVKKSELCMYIRVASIVAHHDELLTQ